MTHEDMADCLDDLRDDQDAQAQQTAVFAAFDAMFGPGAALAFQRGWFRANAPTISNTPTTLH